MIKNVPSNAMNVAKELNGKATPDTNLFAGDVKVGIPERSTYLEKGESY